MTAARIRALLAQVAAGELSVDGAADRLRTLPFDDLGFARLDNHRALRRGVPEVVFGEGKSADQIVLIARSMAAARLNLIVTRLSVEKARLIRRKLRAFQYHPTARLGTVIDEPAMVIGHGPIAVLSAGTSDLPVAEEAALCAELFGNKVVRIHDVGVAGIHRLTAEAEVLTTAAVLVVVAGMEGALPSVVAGLVDKPVVAVPTSVGYGAGWGGIAALLGMLNSCAGGLTVVNIDNGFGAALAATLINRVGLDRNELDGRAKASHPRTRTPRH
jgi:NCAIR mutase (PurE)-related protein